MVPFGLASVLRVFHENATIEADPNHLGNVELESEELTMSTFTGVANFTTTNQSALGPFPVPITLTVFFSNGLSQVSLGSFPSISGPPPDQPISTPLGNDTFTVTLKSGVPGNATGSFDSSSGKLVLSLTLHLHNSVHVVTSGDEDSDMPFTGPQSLTTDSCSSQDGKVSLTGSRFDPTTGTITLAGATQISGGFLDGSDCGLTIAGTLSTPVNTSSQQGFGDLVSQNCMFWTGNFTQIDQEDVLFYHPSDQNWWLAQFGAGVLNWGLADNTAGFGQVADGQHFFWKADFNGNGRDDLLFYFAGDDNWWLGTFDQNGNLTWNLVGNTNGKNGSPWNFGHAINTAMEFWTGDFQGVGRSQVLFYYYGDGNWWLGTIGTNWSLAWANAGNTEGKNGSPWNFGNMHDDRPFWVGDFRGLGRDQILFYSPGDNNWWLGTFDTSGSLTWILAGNTNGFGNAINTVMKFYVGDFQGIGKRQMLFYYRGLGDWWLGTFNQNGALNWYNAGNTEGRNGSPWNFGTLNDGQPFWEGDFSNSYRDDVLFYSASDGNWWDGTFDKNGNLSWSMVGNTSGVSGAPNFGNLVKEGALFFVGDFSDFDTDEVLFYHPSDGNWWLCTLGGAPAQWGLVSSTSV
jgi:hypothetical protein